MNPELLFSALRARFRVLLFVLAGTVMVTLLVSLLMPKTYVATASMLVDSRDEQFMGNGGHERASDRTGFEHAGYMQTQAAIITNEKIAHQVVDDLKLAEVPSIRADFDDQTDGKGTIEDWLVERLLKKLKVDISQSNVIRIQFSSSDAQRSAQVANAFAKAYMDTALELRVEPSRQTAAWFDEQLKGLRSNLEQAHARLMTYQKEKGIASLDERFDIDNLRLSDLANQVMRAQAQQAGVAPPELDSSMRARQSANESIRAELRRAEAKLAEASAQFGTNHPSYQRQLSEVQYLRSSLNAETASSGNVAELSKRREAALRGAMAAQQTRVMELKQFRSQLVVLTRDVEIAQRSYEIAMQRALEKRVESHANLTNISMLSAAGVPFKAARPRIALNIGLSIVIGLMLGLCVVYLMEMFDHRVRSLDDLKNEYAIPVLAELNAWQPAPTHLLGRQRVVPILPYPG